MPAQVFLKPGKEIALSRKHPWIFSGAISRMDPGIQNGDLVTFYAGKNPLGVGHFSDGSIAIRVLQFGTENLSPHFWEEALLKAKSLRNHLFIPSAETNAYRLVHGEGDGLPGLIIDIYGEVAVVQAHSMGMYHSLAEISVALQKIFGKEIQHIYSKSKAALHLKEIEDEWLLGNASSTIIKENGVNFEVNWAEGQKTGFFLDQRDNREYLGSIAKNKKVLNTFCYTGGFSAYALKHGASEVVSVDVSSNAMQMVEKNIALNTPHQGKHTSVCGDVLQFLSQEEELFDIVILDPPAFAKNIAKRHNAVQGYKRLNKLGMMKVKKGGILMTFSCSQVVDDALFKNTITAAAIEAGVNARIIYKFNQAPDHPENIFHPEGHYLKGLCIYIDE